MESENKILSCAYIHAAGMVQLRRHVAPLVELAKAILKVSITDGECLKAHFRHNPEVTTAEQQVYVSFEFIYFYMHMTDRVALRQLGNERRSIVMDDLAIFVIESAIYGFFAHWPTDLKRRMMSDFREKLNEAQADYALCDEVLSEADALNGNGMFATLARNVAELCAQSRADNLAVRTPFTYALNGWGNLDVSKHLDAIAGAM